MAICGVYGIGVPGHGVYVGASIDIEQRLKQHTTQLKGKKHPTQRLQEAWNAVNGEGVVAKVLQECEEMKLKAYEQYWMERAGASLLNKTANSTYWGLSPQRRKTVQAEQFLRKLYKRVLDLEERSGGIFKGDDLTKWHRIIKIINRNPPSAVGILEWSVVKTSKTICDRYKGVALR